MTCLKFTKIKPYTSGGEGGERRRGWGRRDREGGRREERRREREGGREERGAGERGREGAGQHEQACCNFNVCDDSIRYH